MENASRKPQSAAPDSSCVAFAQKTGKGEDKTKNKDERSREKIGGE
jgi:hypothetical protein